MGIRQRTATAAITTPLIHTRDLANGPTRRGGQGRAPRRLTDGQNTFRAVSSMTKLVCRVEFSVPVILSAIVLPM